MTSNIIELDVSQVRRPAVSGTFYPSNPKELHASVQFYLSEAAGKISSTPIITPKAIIAPQAGYKYSGLTAAAAYNSLKPIANSINRVVIMGPCHRIGISGIALPSSQAFDTPIGRIPLDIEAISKIVPLHQVNIFDDTHKEDHAIEVHLPFLQVILKNFSIVPMIVGQSSINEVAEVLQTLWGGDETLILVSSDLSHYLPYDEAQKIDNITCKAIEQLDPTALGEEQACGRNSIKGLMMVAREKGLSAVTVDLRNSGDTAGNKDSVVGYGSWVLTKNKNVVKSGSTEDGFKDATQAILDKHGESMLTIAAKSILNVFANDGPVNLKLQGFPRELQEHGACFVTLQKDRLLRGCVGTIHPTHPLVKDVAYNAYNAAFQDTRFPKLTTEELSRHIISIHISVLSPMEHLIFADEADLIHQLRPGVDGLILADGKHRGVFLPVVWQELPEPKEFFNHLKLKAGLPEDHWSEKIRAWRYVTRSISSEALPNHVNLWRLN